MKRPFNKKDKFFRMITQIQLVQCFYKSLKNNNYYMADDHEEYKHILNLTCKNRIH